MDTTGGFWRELYKDLRPFLVSCAASFPRLARNMTAPSFASLELLKDALSKQVVRSGDLIKLECRPSLFHPFLRHHFLTPLVGAHTGLRLGPSLVGDNPFLGLIAQATTHWMPIGLYPSIELDNVSQVCLYPSASLCTGVVSMLPTDMLPHIPHLFALFADRHVPYCGSPCRVTGVIQSIGDADFLHSGFAREEFEVARQKSNLWLLDVTGDESACDTLHGSEEVPELWGGLYASGHLEITSGRLPVNTLYVGAFVDALEEAGYDQVHVVPNHAGRMEIAIYGQGVRATIDTKSPIFSIHMDAELSRDFGLYRSKFDRISNRVLGNLMQACAVESAELRNPYDLDFCYTNSTEAFTILRSLAADAIRDPIAIAIREWHRRRSGLTGDVAGS